MVNRILKLMRSIAPQANEISSWSDFPHCNSIISFPVDSIINVCAQCNIQVHSLDVFRAHRVEQLVIKVCFIAFKDGAYYCHCA